MHTATAQLKNNTNVGQSPNHREQEMVVTHINNDANISPTPKKMICYGGVKCGTILMQNRLFFALSNNTWICSNLHAVWWRLLKHGMRIGKKDGKCTNMCTVWINRLSFTFNWRRRAIFVGVCVMQ